MSEQIISPDGAWRRRYGAELDRALPNWNETLEVILGHRSVRTFSPRPLPEGTLETIVAAAQSASNSSNLQTWSVVAVQDEARRDRLAGLCGNQQHVRDAPLQLLWIADLSRLHRLGDAQGRAAAAIDYLECFLMAVIDTALAAQTAFVALESLGLNAVYIGGMRNHPEDVARELNLPPRAFVTFGMSVGYADKARPTSVKPRLPQRVVLHREQYDGGPEAAEIAVYDATVEAFNIGQGRGQGWIGPTLARVAGPQSLSGRDRLKAALNALGFPLT